ncbi:LytR/AlgR family response regulator transcription factor [Chitinophaga cymbidii]|uniref:DNA-binding response regulator n=1 Tax=Chitinophaga cymbidii TaxID=1096750 RepID=A0A512RLT0_9BACT|nr:LytTR family DNA-binding domain-containing protein [Chitinophaga cymbidii]GEP96655.1 DNA-binding response regulator [Chitinophaga cymbidii]
MMKSLRILIIEDEPVNARNLAFVLQDVDAAVEIVATLPSVDASVSWLTDNRCDLIFMDIQLADGLSFEIFNRVNIMQPVVFVSAFDEYALKAFRANGIDYVLKPFLREDIERALDKYKRWTQAPADVTALKNMIQALQQAPVYKRSFLVHYRDRLIPVPVAGIAWFYSKSEVVQACTAERKQYFIDHTLEELQQLLDPADFFRANRQFIVQRKYILEVDFYFNGRLLLNMEAPAPEHILVSKARAPFFRDWMNS